ncbi:MAG: flagellar assembly protein FliW, partial [Lachnospiraceae bacterium]|nr:flagellar assembly protein FliW [Lachnospiraceae bacterium]
VLTTVTVPHEIENMSINLMAPLIINIATKKATQIIVENGDY